MVHDETTRHLLPGTEFARYRIERELGRGGMGVVYLAKDHRLERKVALKCLAPALTGDVEMLTRFRNEALAAAELKHPAIATIHDVDESQGVHFITMEYLEGETLADRINRGPMPIEQVLKIGLAAAEGLAHAHEKGILHRDIKGANLMVTKEGQLKILDFGLAQRSDNTQITTAGMTMGTLAYLSPEQIQGQPADHRSDIWSLGIVLYECLTGKSPFEAETTPALLARIQSQQGPTSPRELREEIPEELEGLVLRCLEKEPEARFPSAGDLVAELRQIAREIDARQLLEDRGLSLSSSISSWARMFGSLTVYLLFTWAVIEITARLVRRLELSPHLSHLLGWVLLLLLPTVLFLAWSKLARSSLQRRLRLAIVPTNLLVMILVVYQLFHDKDLGALTHAVTVEDDEGRLIERVVPKADFIRHLAVFFFENSTEDEDLQFLAQAIPDLLTEDLDQDMYMDTYGGAFDCAIRLKRAGHDPLVDLPRPLLREFAQRMNAEHYLTGSIDRTDSLWSLRLSMYESRSDRKTWENTYTGEDIFALVDQGSLGIRRALKIPEPHIEREVDLEVAQMATSSLEALRAFNDAQIGLIFGLDRDQAYEDARRALDADPNFCHAHMMCAVASLMSGRLDRARKSSEAALEVDYRLPERSRLELRAIHFMVTDDMDSAVGVTRRWSTLYPHDVEALQIQAMAGVSMGDRALTISALEEAVRRDAARADIRLLLGEQYRLAEKPEQAEREFKIYRELLPNDERGLLELGDLYVSTGRLDDALSSYEDARLLKPQDMAIRTALADLEARTGDFGGSEANLEAALEAVSEPIDKFRILSTLVHHHWRLGQYDRALERDGERMKALGKLQSILLTLPLEDQIAGGRAPFERKLLETETGTCRFSDRAAMIAHYDDKKKSMGIYAAILDLMLVADSIALCEYEFAREKLDKITETPMWSQLRLLFGPIADELAARLSHAQNDYAEAAERYRSARESNPDALRYSVGLARSLRLAGSLDEAENELIDLLDQFPSHPAAQHEMAQLCTATERIDLARTHLAKALSAWTGADTDFAPAIEARGLAERLEVSLER